MAAYLLTIKPFHIAQIFKSDLEADLMLDIFRFFNSQPSEWFKANSGYLADFITGLQAVKPFELTCEFLMEDEISIITALVSSLQQSTSSPQVSGI